EARRAREAEIARDYPWHGLVRAKLLRVRREPNRDAEVVGWIRRGEKVHVASTAAGDERCAGGFYALYPEGYACAPHEILVGEEPPHANFHLDSPTRYDEALPHDYFYVKRQLAPQFLREPTEEEHRATLAYLRRLQHFQEQEPNRLGAFREGKLRDEPTKPEVLFDILARGNFVASPHREHRDGDRFVRTIQGRVMLASMLELRTGSTFEGVAITAERPLPIAWSNRPARPLIAERRDDGRVRFTTDEAHPLIERYQILDGLPPRTRVGEHFVHEVSEGRYLKEWFVSVARLVQPTFELGADELWLHVDLSEQTLVVYRGRTPVFATLVSTGLAGHDTPRGLYRIERKFV
ncbi:MAG: L,D-transpeptidase family protein, partial [Polyangiaceae bacterium]|nr:L,D-transpeptidase family protein [Polyangiaceae bacterium]